MRVLAALLIVTAVVLVAAEPAWACAVCGTQKTENDWAFNLSTLFLSLLPPAMMGGLVYFLVRAVRKNARDQEETSVSTPD